MTGGMICPPILAVVSTAPANTDEYPNRFINGIVNDPTVNTLATPDPLIIPMKPDEMTETFAGPPFACPTVPSATSLNRRIIPLCSRKLPKRMNRKMYVAETSVGMP